MTRIAGRAIASLSGIAVNIEGAQPAANVPAVIVANHASFIDGLVLLLALKDPARSVASVELERQPLFGSFLRRLDCAFVERGTAGRRVDTVDRLAKLVRDEECLVIFPEGSITRASGLRQFHLGAFAVAASAGVRSCPWVSEAAETSWVQGATSPIMPRSLL
jgi:1-acyl-sn-glycerol-3-phosphate acyltransferase